MSALGPTTGPHVANIINQHHRDLLGDKFVVVAAPHDQYGRVHALYLNAVDAKQAELINGGGVWLGGDEPSAVDALRSMDVAAEWQKWQAQCALVTPESEFQRVVEHRVIRWPAWVRDEVAHSKRDGFRECTAENLLACLRIKQQADDQTTIEQIKSALQQMPDDIRARWERGEYNASDLRGGGGRGAGKKRELKNPVRSTIIIEQHQRDFFAALGDGNLSEGLRVAYKQLRQHK